MIFSPRVTWSTRYGPGVLDRADRLEQRQRTGRRAAVQRARQRAHAADDRGGDVGAGRADHPRREGGGVEAVVDRGDLVLLDGPAEVLVELLAGEHPEVVGAVAEVFARGDRLLALLEPVDRHDQRGHHRAQLQGVAPALGLVDVEGGLVALGGADHRHGRPHALHHRLARRRQGREQLGDRRRDDPQRVHLGGERLALGGARAGGPRRGGATRPRAGACRPARRRCTGGSGRSPRGRARRPPTSRRRSRPRARAAPRWWTGAPPAGSAPRS